MSHMRHFLGSDTVMSNTTDTGFLRRTADRLREIAAIAETTISEDLRRMAEELEQHAAELEPRE